MNYLTYHVKIGLMIADNFKLGNGLKPDGLAPNLFNIALEYAIKELSVEVKSTILYKTVLLKGHADNINIMGRTQGSVCDVYSYLFPCT